MPGESVFLNDLRGCSFEQFVAFAFDRPVPASEKEANWWHVEEDVELLVDPALQLEHARRLFADPLFLRERFTPEQIEQGFWFLCFAGISGFSRFFPDLLWNRQAPLTARIAVIEAMYDLYEQLFAPFPTEAATYMWWDLLASEAIEDERGYSVVPRSDPDEEQIRLAMVRTLARILKLDARHCQEAALHGLNHIATAEERAAHIDAFLQTRRDDKLTTYAHECREGSAQ